MVKGVSSLCYILVGKCDCVTTIEEFTFSVCSFIGAHFFYGRIFMKCDLEMYKKMYSKLFNSVTDVIEICKDEKSVELLKKAQKETEEIYITYYE